MSDSHEQYEEWLRERRRPPNVDVVDNVLAKIEQPQAPRELASAGRWFWLLSAGAKCAAIAGAMLFGVLRLSWFLVSFSELR